VRYERRGNPENHSNQPTLFWREWGERLKINGSDKKIDNKKLKIIIN